MPVQEGNQDRKIDQRQPGGHTTWYSQQWLQIVNKHRSSTLIKPYGEDAFNQTHCFFSKNKLYVKNISFMFSDSRKQMLIFFVDKLLNRLLVLIALL